MKNHEKPKKWIACPIEEEYFQDSRKQSRKERKRLSEKDRSKYKKTDQKMIESAEKEALERVGDRELHRGRVLSITSQGVIVDHEGEQITCIVRGLLKKEKTRLKNIVTVGDFILYEPTAEGEGVVLHVEPRRSILSRADNLSRRKEQLIAANIDQVLITASVVSPQLKLPLIDRYIIAALKGEMEPVVLINKIDLLSEFPEETELFEEALSAYRSTDIAVIPISAETGEGLDDLRAAMKDKASVFSGQSGVGKSSLINAVTGLHLSVGDMVKKTRKGAHTTTTAHLVPLEFGGWCIDTPGIKSFGVWDLELEEIQQYFSDISVFAPHCKFPNCTHTHEIDCAVIAALEEGKLSELRYNSYATLTESVQEKHKRR